jgi:hypothetical protein
VVGSTVSRYPRAAPTIVAIEERYPQKIVRR